MFPGYANVLHVLFYFACCIYFHPAASNISTLCSDVELYTLENKIQECQISLNQLFEPKLQKLMEEKAEKERQVTELESLLVSKEKCRLELMNEHASALHSLKSMGESLEAMDEKIQDKKVEGIENSRYIHLHIFTFWSCFKKMDYG